MQTALPPVRNVEVLFRTFIIPARITVHTLIPTEASSNSSIISNITIRISRHTATAGSRCPGKTWHTAKEYRSLYYLFHYHLWYLRHLLDDQDE